MFSLMDWVRSFLFIVFGIFFIIILEYNFVGSLAEILYFLNFVFEMSCSMFWSGDFIKILLFLRGMIFIILKLLVYLV